jgi:hypothetical protein
MNSRRDEDIRVTPDVQKQKACRLGRLIEKSSANCGFHFLSVAVEVLEPLELSDELAAFESPEVESLDFESLLFESPDFESLDDPPFLFAFAGLAPPLA